MSQKIDPRQISYRGTLARLSGTTNPELDNLLESLNAEVTPPLQLKANSPASLIVNVGASSIANPETGLNKALPTIGANAPLLTSGTITFPSATGGTVTVSPGNNTILTIGANEYIKALVYLDANNNLNVLFGTSAALEANATVTAPPDSVIPIGYITLQTIAGVVQNVANTKIYQYVGTGAGGSGSGSGILEPVPGYKFMSSDSFSSIKGSSDDTVDGTYTNATYDAGKKMYQLSLDKSKTVSSNSGTAFAPSGAPTFTVKIGDIVYATSGARSGQWRRISAVASQVSWTLDAAFTGGNMSGGDTFMVSQAVWTLDLVNFGSATELTRPRDFYASENVLQILTDYVDSLTSGDDVGDFTQTARVVMSASNEGLQAATGLPLTSNFTQSIYTRPAAPNQISDYILQTNTNTQRLFLVFFPNPTNGSVTSTCNMLEYVCNFYTEAQAVNGGVLDSAFCISDASGTPYNCTVSSVFNVSTSVLLNFSFNPSADPAGVASQLRVMVDGKVVPKFVSSAVTPSTQLSYTLTTDTNGLYRKVVFNKDLSAEILDIMIFRQFGVYDASFTATQRLLGEWDAIVGTSAQVTAGMATHSSLQAAHDAVAAGSNILVLNNVTLSGATTISKQVHVAGKGKGSVLSGNLTVASGGATSTFHALKVSGNITFNSGADKCSMKQCYRTLSGTFFNDPSNIDNDVFEVIAE